MPESKKELENAVKFSYLATEQVNKEAAKKIDGIVKVETNKQTGKVVTNGN